MSRPKISRISAEEQSLLLHNIAAIEACFVGEEIEGKKLHLLKRYVDERESREGSFRDSLNEKYPSLLVGLDILPSGKTLAKDLAKDPSVRASRATVRKLAAFCTQVFAFDHEITAEDLLTKNLHPLPPMRKVAGLWGRYEGVYRCFCHGTEFSEKEIYGSLLSLKDVDGNLQCRMITNIRTDENFDEAVKLLHGKNADKEEKISKKTGQPHRKESSWIDQQLHLLNMKDQNQKTQMYFYEGSIDDRSCPEYYILKLQRYESQHSMMLFLRSWGKSKKSLYSGGIATVMQCRKEEMLTYPMVVTREKVSLIHEKNLMLKYLAGTVQENGMKETKDMDEQFDREVRLRNEMK